MSKTVAMKEDFMIDAREICFSQFPLGKKITNEPEEMEQVQLNWQSVWDSSFEVDRLSFLVAHSREEKKKKKKEEEKKNEKLHSIPREIQPPMFSTSSSPKYV